MSALLKSDPTAAEKVIVEGYAATGKKLPGDASNTATRERAIQCLVENGLPSRRIESWHYTDLRNLLREVPALDTGQDAKLAASLLSDNSVLGLINGKAVQDKTVSGCVPLKELLSSGTIVLPQAFAADDIISQINTAYVSDGWQINIEAGEIRDQAIEIQNIVNGGQSHTRIPVTIGAGSRSVVIERQTGNNDAAFVSMVNDMTVGENAEVVWIIIRERGAAATELNQFNAALNSGARLRLYIINAGCKLLRQEINVDLIGRGADFQLRGVNLLAEKTHTDTTMTVRHLVEDTTSTEIVRNVTTDQARGVFQGMIRVARIAQKTDARMACNSLILSDEAEFDAKPELEIFADDVACGHGATVTEINHEHLFYLMARGIPEAAARGLLIKAFVSELIEELENETVEEALQDTIDRWLEKHI